MNWQQRVSAIFKALTPDAIGISGAALAYHGIDQISHAAALIIGGVTLIGTAVLLQVRQ